CRPVQFFPNDSSCGVTGCWRYLTIDTDASHATYGALVSDLAHPAFQGCESQLACSTGRRITHYQLNVNYESRLWHNSSLLPPALPSGGAGLPPTLSKGTWKDCGPRPACT